MSGRIGTGKTASLFAGALFEIAREKNVVETVASDLAAVCELYRGDDRFRAFAESPIIENRAKRTVLEKVFTGQVHPLVFNFLRMLASRQRIPLLEGLDQAFQIQIDRSAGRTRANLEFARPADPASVKAIETGLAASTGGEVICEATVDSSLLGGVRIRVGDHLLDGSVKNRLTNLQRHMQETWFHGVQD